MGAQGLVVSYMIPRLVRIREAMYKRRGVPTRSTNIYRIYKIDSSDG